MKKHAYKSIIAFAACVLACAPMTARGDIVFSESFDVVGKDVPGWYECEYSSFDAAVVADGVLRLQDQYAYCYVGTYISKYHGVSTVGYDNLHLRFRWAALTASESTDELLVEVRPEDSRWITVARFPLGGDGSFSDASIQLPPEAANDPSLGLRFRTRIVREEYGDDTWFEGALIDDIVIEGTSLVDSGCVLFADNFNNRVGYDTGWHEDEANPSEVSIVFFGRPRDSLQLKGNWHSAAQTGINTVGREGIELTFYWARLDGSEASDYLNVEYTLDGNYFHYVKLEQYALGGIGQRWNGPVRLYFPSAVENISTFGFRFRLDVRGWYKGALIDNVVVSAPNCNVATDEQPPITSDTNVEDVVFDGAATITATVMDTDSNIASATYELDYLDNSPGTCDACDNPTTMVASDGTFDELEEDVTGTTTGDLFVGAYSACVVGKDAADNESAAVCDDFSVTPANLSIAYNGEYIDLNGSPTTMKATVAGPGACPIGAEVKFYVDDGAGGWTLVGAADTNEFGAAEISATIDYGVYDVKVEVGDQDVGGTTAVECLGAIDDTGMVVVADPNASSTGGGFYMISEHPSVNGDSPKANFGYTAQRKYNKELDGYITSGNMLWMHKGHWRLKGKITEGGKLPEEACPYSGFDVYPVALTSPLACGVFAGEGTLLQYNESYNPYCPSYLPCGQQWINPQEVEFSFAAYDGGSARECVGKGNKCKDVDKPDAFGLIAVQLVDITPSEGDFLIQLKGGNLVLR